MKLRDMRRSGHHEDGDTLVEVLIATAILAAAVVGGLGAMNFGFGLILNAIERTQVQAAMTSQVSLVRYVRDEYVRANRQVTPGTATAVWAQLLADARSGGAQRFYLTSNGTGYTPTSNAPATTATPVAGTGLWAEAESVAPGGGGAEYVDVYIWARWTPATGSLDQEAKTVVRLYVP